MGEEPPVDAGRFRAGLRTGGDAATDGLVNWGTMSLSTGLGEIEHLSDWPRETVSVVVPLYNEAKNLTELCTRLCRVLGDIEDIACEIARGAEAVRNQCGGWRQLVAVRAMAAVIVSSS